MPQAKEVSTTQAKKAREEMLTRDCGIKTDASGLFWV